MKKKTLFILLAAASVFVLIIIGISTAFFTDVEVKDNNITIGEISVELDEGDFDPTESHDVVPGSVTEKSPKLINTGNKDEFVFMRITVPKGAVTLLNESGSDKGTPRNDLDGSAQQLFKIIADSEDPDTNKEVDSVSGKDIDFTYHSNTTSGSETVEGWVLLESDYTADDVDTYAFGYNAKLTPSDDTVTLFDRVQLKSFIDTEVSGDITIGVFGYGIQTEYLKPDGTHDFTADYLSDDALRAIYSIVKNKAGI